MKDYGIAAGRSLRGIQHQGGLTELSIVRFEQDCRRSRQVGHQFQTHLQCGGRMRYKRQVDLSEDLEHHEQDCRRSRQVGHQLPAHLQSGGRMRYKRQVDLGEDLEHHEQDCRRNRQVDHLYHSGSHINTYLRDTHQIILHQSSYLYLRDTRQYYRLWVQHDCCAAGN